MRQLFVGVFKYTELLGYMESERQLIPSRVVHEKMGPSNRGMESNHADKEKGRPVFSRRPSIRVSRRRVSGPIGVPDYHLLSLITPDRTRTIRESRPVNPQTGTNILLHFGHVTGMEDTVALSSMSKAMKDWPQCGQVTR